MSLTEAFELADGLRLSSLTLCGHPSDLDRDGDLQDLIELKRKLTRAHAARCS